MLAHLSTLFLALMATEIAASPIGKRGCAKPLQSRGASSKRGFSWPGQEGALGHYAGQLTQDGTMTWFWNWGLWRTDIPQAPEFVGQLWNADHLSELDGNCPSMIFGFNEPDHSAVGLSANMDVGSAVWAWKEAKRKCPGSKWGSPALSGPHHLDWLRAFFEGICPGGLDGCADAPDYINFHTYQSDINRLKEDVNAMKQFGRPLILSEFACHDFSDARKECTDVMAYAREAFDFLDNDDMVYRYSWFGAMADANHLGGVSRVNMLINDGGDGLTPLGRLYLGQID